MVYERCLWIYLLEGYRNNTLMEEEEQEEEREKEGGFN